MAKATTDVTYKADQPDEFGIQRFEPAVDHFKAPVDCLEAAFDSVEPDVHPVLG